MSSTAPEFLSPGTPSGRGRAPLTIEFRLVSGCLLVALLLALGLAGAYGAPLGIQAIMNAGTWGLGLWSTGTLAGFLFALPRVNQGSGARGTSQAIERPMAYQFLINHNLIEIADWLTKIIVGLGLVELRSVPGHLWTLAGSMSAGLEPSSFGHARTSRGLFERMLEWISRDPHAHQSFCLAAIVLFLVLGFLFGYLSTRLFLAGAIGRADLDALSTTGVLQDELSRVRDQRDDLRTLVSAGQNEAPRAATAAADEGTAQLNALAGEMDALDLVADREEKVVRKRAIASRMLEVVARGGIGRDWLASQTNDHLLIALATVVNALPEPGDAERLLRSGKSIKRWFVQYRYAVAFDTLAEQRLITEKEAASAIEMLRGFAQTGDEPLRAKVERTVAKLLKIGRPPGPPPLGNG